MDEILVESEYRSMHSPVTNGIENERKPDPDAIKMFVGQVPRSMDENDLTKMFEQYGSVFQLNVLRDKVSGQSKGCCFVTFFTRKGALDAQNALHNIKTLPGMHHPVQMKPADSEKRNGEQQSEERKLFIGMLSKKFNETDVKMMFAPFGNIEDCTVLRDQNGQSRGCAFITYSNRQSAQNCIKQMHHSQTMEGCSSPLVVKLADTQKEKEQKKLQSMNANLLMSLAGGNTAVGNGGGGFTTNIGPQYLALLQQAMATGNLGMFSNMGNIGLNAMNIQQLLTALATATSNPGLLAALAALASGNSGSNNNSASSNNSSGSNSAAGDASNNMHIQNLQGLAALANATSSPGGFNAGQGNQANIASAMATLMQNIGNFGGNMGPNMMGMKMEGNMGNMMGGGNMGGGNMGGGNMGGGNMGGNMGGGNMGGNMMGNGMGGNMNGNMANMQGNNMGGGMGGNMMQNMGGANQHMMNGGDGNSMGHNPSKPASLSGSLSTSNSSLSGYAGLQNFGNNNMAARGMSPSITNGLNNNSSGIDALTQAYSGIQQYAGLSGLLSPAAASFPGAFSTQAAQQLQAANSAAGKQTEGPEGANLFIYHLPQEFSDQDLMQTFMPFGSVISAKVFIDKQTNLSKCFGFVSYDNAVSAQAAIQAMNGFQIGMKRLKVQLKRPKNDSKPY